MRTSNAELRTRRFRLLSPSSSKLEVQRALAELGEQHLWLGVLLHQVLHMDRLIRGGDLLDARPGDGSDPRPPRARAQAAEEMPAG